jgi:hypothetical protein
MLPWERTAQPPLRIGFLGGVLTGDGMPLFNEREHAQILFQTLISHDPI